MKAMPVTKAGVAAKPAAKKAAKRTAATAPAAKKSPAKESVPAKKVVAEPRLAAKRPVSAGTGAKAARVLPDAAATIRRLTDSLRKMGKKRPTKPASFPWSASETGALPKTVEMPAMSMWVAIASESTARQSSGSRRLPVPQAASASIHTRVGFTVSRSDGKYCKPGCGISPVRHNGTGTARAPTASSVRAPARMRAHFTSGFAIG
jgi:hypothetical protein